MMVTTAATDEGGAGPSPPPRRRARRPRPRSPQTEEDAAQERQAEETLLALRMMRRVGFRHPLHGHAYARYTALRPRACASCDGPIFGPFSKACHCLACGLVVHRQCVMRITKTPCGSFRGLRDPQGLTSTPARAPRPSDQADGGLDPASLPRAPAFGDAAHKEEGEGKGAPSPRDNAERAAPAGPAKEKEGIETTKGAAAAAQRSMTYEALAMVGGLVRGMVDAGPSGAFTAIKLGGATLRSGASAVAGAYASYATGRGRTASEEAVTAALLAFPFPQGTPSPVGMAWSQLAQRTLRRLQAQPRRSQPGPQEEQGAGEARLPRAEEGHEEEDDGSSLLDFAAFVRYLDALEAQAAAGGSAQAKQALVSPVSPSSPGPNNARGGLIGDIVRSPRTAPGYLWAACLRRFRRRHQGLPCPSETDLGRGAGEGEGEEEDEQETAALPMPHGTSSQDAAAIIHEVALVLVDFVPGLLTQGGPTSALLPAYEEAFEAVEGVVMATLAPAVLAECGAQTRDMAAALEAWYAQPEREDSGEGAVVEAALDKAAEQLRAMAREVTGMRKVRRVLRCCLALGGGESGGVVTSDELLPALGRAVRRAAVPDLPAHLAFIEETCDTGALLGAEGYALTSLQVVVSLIIQPPPEAEEEAAAKDERAEQQQHGMEALGTL